MYCLFVRGEVEWLCVHEEENIECGCGSPKGLNTWQSRGDGSTRIWSLAKGLEAQLKLALEVLLHLRLYFFLFVHDRF